MYFTVNLAFVNYFDEAIEDLGIHVWKNWTTQEQILPISVLLVLVYMFLVLLVL